VLTGLYKGVAVDFPRHMLPWYFRFILSYGIFLMLIPVFWTSATIRLENHPVLRYHRVWTFVTGMLMLIGLTYRLSGRSRFFFVDGSSQYPAG